jgi:hypothetical protein
MGFYRNRTAIVKDFNMLPNMTGASATAFLYYITYNYATYIITIYITEEVEFAGHSTK